MIFRTEREKIARVRIISDSDLKKLLELKEFK